MIKLQNASQNLRSRGFPPPNNTRQSRLSFVFIIVEVTLVTLFASVRLSGASHLVARGRRRRRRIRSIRGRLREPVASPLPLFARHPAAIRSTHDGLHTVAPVPSSLAPGRFHHVSSSGHRAMASLLYGAAQAQPWKRAANQQNRDTSECFRCATVLFLLVRPQRQTHAWPQPTPFVLLLHEPNAFSLPLAINPTATLTRAAMVRQDTKDRRY